MESEDDMHDANDLEDDDFYSGETGIGSDDEDNGYEFGGGDASDGSDDITSHRQQQSYTVLSDSDIRQRQEEDISRVSSVLSISRVSVCILLRHYHWSVSKVHDEWFVDEQNVRRTVGLLENSVEMPNDRELTCGICFESYPREMMSAAACGHPFCGACWQGDIVELYHPVSVLHKGTYIQTIPSDSFLPLMSKRSFNVRNYSICYGWFAELGRPHII